MASPSTRIPTGLQNTSTHHSRNQDLSSLIGVISELKIEEKVELVKSPILSKQVESSYKEGNEQRLDMASKHPREYTFHYERNKNNIRNFSQGMTGTALILGLGNGNDIPLADLAAQFDRLTVMDIDKLTVQKTIGKLPAELQGKIQVVQEDITGIIPFISKYVENIDSNLPEADCVAQIAELINNCITKQTSIPCSDTFNFVVSSMLTAQLFSQIHAYILEILVEKYPKMDERISEYNNFQDSIANLMRYVCRDHLEHLAEWTAKDGKIYYADSEYADIIGGAFISQRKEYEITTFFVPKILLTMNTLPLEKVHEKIKEIFFSLKEADHWDWITSPPLLGRQPYRCVQPGSAFKIAAHYLQPKKA